MKTAIPIQNLKCGGCASTIKNRISELNGVHSIEVNLETSTVLVEHEMQLKISEIKNILRKIGYPEVGEANSLGEKAKSFVSCAIGKLS
jgi:copper chaperone